MSKLPDFWRFFNLTSQPFIPSLYWDSYSYEERIKKICDKIWAILSYLKLIMELLDEFDDRITVIEELYNALEKRVTILENLYQTLKNKVENIDARVTNIEQVINELNIDELVQKVNALETQVNTLSSTVNDINNSLVTINNDITNIKGNIKTIKSNIASINAEITSIKADIATLMEEVANLTLNNKFNLKFANSTETAPYSKIIEPYKPLLFKTIQSISKTDNEWSFNDYVVDSVDINIGTWDEIVGASTSINNIAITENAIVLDDGNTRYITDNNHTYYLLMLISTSNGYKGFFKDAADNSFVEFTKLPSEIIWSRNINKFIESSNAETAKTASASDPNKIYYVVETEG